ncbi:MAG: histidine kinase dimerization/phosphoacceptor domain -containing protein [bacterium]
MTIDSNSESTAHFESLGFNVRDLFQSIADPILLLDADTARVLQANEAAQHLADRPTALTNHTVPDLLTQFKTIDDWTEFVQTLNRDGSKRLETRFLKETESPVPVEVHWGYEQGKSHPVVTATLRETQSRLETRQALRENQERIRAMAENIQETFWMFNHDFSELLLVNGEYKSMFGGSISNLYSNPKAFLQRMHPEDRPKVKRKMTKIMQGENIDFKCRVNPSLSYRTIVRIHGTPIENENGEVQYLTGTAIDVTRQEKALRELQASEERFQQLAEHIDAVFWMNDLSDDAEPLYVSPPYERIWERPRADFMTLKQAFLKAVVEEDKTKVQNAYRDAIDGGYDIEYRITTPDGREKWIHDRCFPVKNDEGKIYRLCGIAEDITDFKSIQNDLEVAVDQKETLLQEIHHRVKNNLQVISSMLRLQFDELTDTEDQNSIQQTLDRIKSMALTHEILYQSDNVDDLPFDEFAQRLIDQIVLGHSPDHADFDCHLEVASVSLALEKAIPCGLILNELVTNAFKHGLSDREEGSVEIYFRDQGDHYELTVKDSGTGFPADFEPEQSNSLGYQLIDSLVKTNLDGSYEISNDNGARTVIRFPA